MADEQIVVRIGPDGTVQAETHGMVGPKCLDSVEVLESLLEARVTYSEYTWEYSVQEHTATAAASVEADDELRLR